MASPPSPQFSPTDETGQIAFKRGAKEIFDESFKIFSLLSPGSPNVSQKLFPCLLPHISQRKQKPPKRQLSRGTRLLRMFFCLELGTFVYLREMHGVGIINWILVRLSCPLFQISDSGPTNYTMGLFSPRITMENK